MDLAVALGQPAASLARNLTEGEFQDWQAYAARRMLPQRRLELYLAQIALLIATTMGGAKNKKLSDFLFDPVDPGSDEPTAEDEAAFFDFKPRNRKKED